MIKSLLIYILLVCLGVVTILYLIEIERNKKLSHKVQELTLKAEKIKSVEVEAKRDTIYLFRTKIENKYIRDTIFIYKVKPYYRDGYSTLEWTFEKFLKIKDTIFVEYDSNINDLKISLKRFYRIENPINVFVSITEKKPDMFYWSGYIYPEDISKYINLLVYDDIKRSRIYLGAGLVLNKKILPTIGLSFEYRKNLISFDLSKNFFAINYKQRLF